MLRGGAFDDVAAAMMVHAAPSDSVGMSSLAISSWKVGYTGRSAHAAAMPERGVNAADAMMIAQVAIAAYRQQMRPGAVVSGVVTSGGEAANVIPAHTAADYDCRAGDQRGTPRAPGPHPRLLRGRLRSPPAPNSPWSPSATTTPTSART